MLQCYSVSTNLCKTCWDTCSTNQQYVHKLCDFFVICFNENKNILTKKKKKKKDMFIIKICGQMTYDSISMFYTSILPPTMLTVTCTIPLTH